MIKRFLVFLTICFLLIFMFAPVVQANPIIYDYDPDEELFSLIIAFILIIAIIIVTIVLIRIFGKPKK